jgi:hypothetical protein
MSLQSDEEPERALVRVITGFLTALLIGGERLRGSGFERETTETGISGIVPAAPGSQPHTQ